MNVSLLTRSLRACAMLVLAGGILPFFAIPVQAQPQSQDPNQGKLFTTAYEREYLDYLRRNFLAERAASGFSIDDVPPPIIEEEQTDVTAEAAPVLYTLGGIIRRSDNHRSVWLNNRLVAEDELPDNMHITETGDGLVLRITDQGRSFQLKSGQTLNMNTGEILESFQLPARSAPGASGALNLLPEVGPDTGTVS